MCGTMNKETLEKYTRLKNLLKELHEKKDVEELKEKLKEILEKITPWEIGFIEQMLIKDGIRTEEIALLCNAHVELFKEKLVGNKELLKIPEGHPLNTLLKETQEFLGDIEELSMYLNMLKTKGITIEIINSVREILVKILGIKKHFMRIQLLIFPYLERKGLTAIPRVLWSRQDTLYGLIKSALKNTNEKTWENNLNKYIGLLEELINEATNMVFRETRIFYPTLCIILNDMEWSAIYLNKDVIGYYVVKRGNMWKPSKNPVYPYMISSFNKETLEKLPGEIKNLVSNMNIEIDQHKFIRENDIELDSGYLSVKELNAILKTLPFDISFVDRENRLRYYNETPNRVFPRAKTALDRPVEYCHPPRSIHLVKRIIKEFREGVHDKAVFWINFRGRIILITYYPVKDENGEYLGTLEAVQDITDLRKIQGEKRLLD